MPITPPTKDSTTDREKVQETRTNYKADAQRFQFLRDAIEGTGGFQDYLGRFYANTGFRVDMLPQHTYLRKHPRESEARWTRRLETSFYTNFVSWILGVALGLLTRETPGREGYPEQLEEWMDANQWENIRSLLYWWALGYGELYALVDRPRREQKGKSAAQVKDGGAYVRMIHPDRVLDYSRKNGELEWLKYSESVEEKPGPLEPLRKGDRVWILTTTDWWYYDLWEDENDLKEIKVTALGKWEGKVTGRVPVAVFRSRDETIGGIARSPAFIEPPARIGRRLHNVLSFKAQTQDSSCVPYLVVPVKDHEELKKMRVGSSAAIPDDPQSTKSAHFAAYDTGPLEHLSGEVDRLIKLMKEVVSLAFDDDSAETGIAKSYAFLQLNVTLASQVTALEQFELDILDLVERFEGRAGMPDGAKVSMPRKFDLTDAKADIEMGIQLLTAEYGPVGVRVIKEKMLLQRYAQDLDSETKADVEQELKDEATMDADTWPEGKDEDDEGDPAETPTGQTQSPKDPKLKPEQTEGR